jgi:multicomponent Na+:H+ antiporter subunit F
MLEDVMLVQWAGRLTLILLILAMCMAFYRLVRGPDAVDRIVALDMISILIVAFLAAYSIYAAEPSLLDVAIAYALIAFLGTVAFARYRERMSLRRRASESEKDK